MKIITAALLILMLASCGPVMNSGKKICDGVKGVQQATALMQCNTEEKEKKQQADQPILLYRMLVNM